MKVLKRNDSEGFLHLRLDSRDDLWALQTLVRAGDLVEATTMRTAPETTEKLRSEKREKRTVRLGVRVDSVEWHGFDDHLRVLGPIETGPQDHGRFHTLVFTGEGEDVHVRKREPLGAWVDQVLDDAVAATARPAALVLAIDDSEAQFAVLRSFGVQFLGSLPAQGQGKRHPGAQQAKSDFFREVVRSLRAMRATDAPLLVVGPGWWREEFLAHARHEAPETVREAVTEGTSQGGRAGVQEALRTGLLARVAGTHRVAGETELLETLWERVGKGDQRVAYGTSAVTAAAKQGAVETLLLSDQAARSGAADEAARDAQRRGAMVRVVSTHHEAGARLEQWGGVAALLRYAVE